MEFNEQDIDLICSLSGNGKKFLEDYSVNSLAELKFNIMSALTKLHIEIDSKLSKLSEKSQKTMMRFLNKIEKCQKACDTFDFIEWSNKDPREFSMTHGKMFEFDNLTDAVNQLFALIKLYSPTRKKPSKDFYALMEILAAFKKCFSEIGIDSYDTSILLNQLHCVYTYEGFEDDKDESIEYSPDTMDDIIIGSVAFFLHFPDFSPLPSVSLGNPPLNGYFLANISKGRIYYSPKKYDELFDANHKAFKQNEEKQI